MHVIKRAGVLAAIGALAVALAACGNSGSTGDSGGSGGQAPSTQAQYNPQPYNNIKDGGTLTTALPEISPQFNPYQGDATLYSLTAWNWYNPVLVTFGPTGDVSFNKDFLTDVKQETVGGNTQVTYTINPKAVYNDGSPIDWTSFEATWKANNATDPQYIVLSSDGYSSIASVRPGVDTRQAVVTFKGTDVWWQGLFNNLLNPKALVPDTFNKGYINSPHPEWGAGPYELSKYDKQNGTITFTRNPKWWGDKGKLDARTFLALETSARINAFKNGQLDASAVSAKDQLAQVQGMTGIDIRKSVSTQTDLITLNSKSPILSDIRIRKAVFEGVDRGQISKIFFQGLGFSATPPGSLVLLSFQKGYQDNLSKVVTFNVNQAKKDLDAAGWVAGADGFRAKDGKPLEFTYVNSGDDAVGKATASALVAMMKNIGVKLNVRQVSSSDFSTIITGRQFDMFFSGFGQTDPFGMAYICQVYCSDSQLNISGTGQAALDAAVKSVNQLPTAEQQFVKGNEVETEALKTYGVMPVLNPVAIIAVKQGLANYGAGLYFTSLPQNIGFQK